MEDLLSNYQSQDMDWGCGGHDGHAAEEFVTQSQVEPLEEDMYHVVPPSPARQGNGTQSLMERATEMARHMSSGELTGGHPQVPACLGQGHGLSDPPAAVAGVANPHGPHCGGGPPLLAGPGLVKEGSPCPASLSSAPFVAPSLSSSQMPVPGWDATMPPPMGLPQKRPRTEVNHGPATPSHGSPDVPSFGPGPAPPWQSAGSVAARLACQPAAMSDGQQVVPVTCAQVGGNLGGVAMPMSAGTTHRPNATAASEGIPAHSGDSGCRALGLISFLQALDECKHEDVPAVVKKWLSFLKSICWNHAAQAPNCNCTKAVLCCQFLPPGPGSGGPHWGSLIQSVLGDAQPIPCSPVPPKKPELVLGVISACAGIGVPLLALQKGLALVEQSDVGHLVSFRFGVCVVYECDFWANGLAQLVHDKFPRNVAVMPNFEKHGRGHAAVGGWQPISNTLGVLGWHRVQGCQLCKSCAACGWDKSTALLPQQDLLSLASWSQDPAGPCWD